MPHNRDILIEHRNHLLIVDPAERVLTEDTGVGASIGGIQMSRRFPSTANGDCGLQHAIASFARGLFDGDLEFRNMTHFYSHTSVGHDTGVQRQGVRHDYHYVPLNNAPEPTSRTEEFELFWQPIKGINELASQSDRTALQYLRLLMSNVVEVEVVR